MNLEGLYQVQAGELTGICQLPGTLDEAGIGTTEKMAESWHPVPVIEDIIGCPFLMQ